VRRSREAAARTRRTALEAASRLFRERGIDAVGVRDVMSSVGLTDGGFYRHFESKDALAAEACAAACTGSALARGPSRSVDALLRGYLSTAHRDARATGCPLTALVSEMPRQSGTVRRAYTNGVRGALSRLEQLAPGADAPTRRALLASMVGALALARAVDDDELSSSVLEGTRQLWIRALPKRRPVRSRSAPRVNR